MPSQKPKTSGKNLSQLTPREHIRRRPGMYVGGTDKRALHHLIWAATDHMVEEAMLGYCSYIYVHLLPDNKVIIESDGTTLIHDLETVEDVTTTLIDLFINFEWRISFSEATYGLQGDLHRMSLTVINSLSKNYHFEIQHDGNHWQQSFEQGIATSEVIHRKTDTRKQFTRITFTPDFEVMEENHFDLDTIAARFQDLSYLMPNIALHIEDHCWGMQTKQFMSHNGLADWVFQADSGTPHHDIVSGETVCEVTSQSGNNYNVAVQFAFQFTTSKSTQERSFINTITSPDGGTHIDGLHQAILNAVFLDQATQPQWETVKQGFIGIVHLSHPEPQFESRSRVKILNPENYQVLEQAVHKAFQDQPEALKQIRQLLMKRVR